MTYWHSASAPSGGCGLHDIFLGLVLEGELVSFLYLLGLFSLLLGWDPASGSEGLSEGVCLVILRVGGVSLGVVFGSGLVFGARPD